jgi:signal transduction histidine kinase
MSIALEPRREAQQGQQALRPKSDKGVSLTARLLILAAGFVVLTEAIVFVPTIASFRHQWLTERFDTGELAALAARSPATDGFVRGDPEELMRAADIHSVSVVSNGLVQRLIGVNPTAPIRAINLESQTLGGAIFDVFETFGAPKDRVLALTSRPRSNAAIKLEVIVSESSLRAGLLREITQVFAYSMLLALMIGLLIYAALVDNFVRPLRRLTGAIMRFRAAPEDASHALVPTGRKDEIGEAEVAFADMQETVRQAFFQKERLAQLGLSVSKISHDLRHSLGAAQLVSERLASVDDPMVRMAVPRLERALERAIGLAQSTLKFGKAQEAQPIPELIYLADALDEAANDALNGLIGVSWDQRVDNRVESEVDPDQLHRILTNLIRNAGQAIVSSGKTGSITASLASSGDDLCLDLKDTGPGLPRGVKDNLFAPFSGSGVSGGTGLGLAIARDLARMNGGEIRLISTGTDGTCFRLCLRKPGATD